MTMFKLETMIYASEDGTSSVFTLNPALQKQLDTLASQHPEVTLWLPLFQVFLCN